MKRYFSSIIKRQKYLLAVGDAIVISLSVFLTYIINIIFFTHSSYSFNIIFNRILPWAAALVLLYIFIFYSTELYTKDKIKNLFYCLITISISVLVVSLIGSGILFFFTKYIIGRKIIIINIPISIALLMLWRFIFITYISKNEKAHKLALIGSSQIISSFIKEFNKLDIKRFIITQTYITGSAPINKNLLSGSTVIYKNLDDLLKKPEFDTLAFDYTKGELSDQEIRRILQLKFQGRTISDFPSFYEELTGKVPLNCIDSRWLISRTELQGKTSKFYSRLKRLIDIFFSAIFLVITSPLGLFIAITIKVTSRGNILLKQERLGIRKHPFICYKFRTMKMGAEKETGPIWSNKNDPRITSLGKILRKIRLDELPQLWNILKGDMSFIGNRPIRKYFANELSEIIPFYDLRFSIKPGLTGWAQINHDYSGSKEGQYEKFQYELFYIKNMSLFLDFYIIFKTFKIMIQGRGV